MRFFLKSKKLQMIRITFLLGAGAVLGYAMWIAFNLKYLSPIPILLAIVFIIVVTVWGMKSIN